MPLLAMPCAITTKVWRQYQAADRPLRNSSKRSPASAGVRRVQPRRSSSQLARAGGRRKIMPLLGPARGGRAKGSSAPAGFAERRAALGRLHGNSASRGLRARPWIRLVAMLRGLFPPGAPMRHRHFQEPLRGHSASRFRDRWGHRTRFLRDVLAPEDHQFEFAKICASGHLFKNTEEMMGLQDSLRGRFRYVPANPPSTAAAMILMTPMREHNRRRTAYFQQSRPGRPRASEAGVHRIHQQEHGWRDCQAERQEREPHLRLPHQRKRDLPYVGYGVGPGHGMTVHHSRAAVR